MSYRFGLPCCCWMAHGPHGKRFAEVISCSLTAKPASGGWNSTVLQLNRELHHSLKRLRPRWDTKLGGRITHSTTFGADNGATYQGACCLPGPVPARSGAV